MAMSVCVDCGSMPDLFSPLIWPSSQKLRETTGDAFLEARVFTTEIGKKEKASQLHWRSAHSHTLNHLSARQCARIVKGGVKTIGLDPAMYGTRTMRRAKASPIHRKTKSLRTVHLLRHTKPESTVRYLGIEADDALEIAEKTEV